MKARPPADPPPSRAIEAKGCAEGAGGRAAAATAGVGGYLRPAGAPATAAPATAAASAERLSGRSSAEGPGGDGRRQTMSGDVAGPALEEAATRIQAQVRRRRDSEDLQYELMSRALNQMESKEESERLEANLSFARASAILDEQAEDPATTPTAGGSLSSVGGFLGGASPRAAAAALGLPGGDGGRLTFFDIQAAASPRARSAAPSFDRTEGDGSSVCGEVGGVPELVFEAAQPSRDGKKNFGGMRVPRKCVDAVLRHLKKPEPAPLAPECLRALLLHTTELLRLEVQSALIEISTPKPGQCVVVGDTHGQLVDLLFVFFRNGEPSAENVYVLNGDIADRGRSAVDIFVVAMLMKLWDPSCIHVNRGNHEDRSMNESYGFLDECVDKYGLVQGLEIYELFNLMFEHLPLYTLIDDSVFVVHGGLGRFTGSLAQLRRIDFRRPMPPPTRGAPGGASPADAVLFDSVWADPMPSNGFGMSNRGSGIVTFGPDVTKRFLRLNKLRLLVRSHEVPAGGRGFEYHHDGSCLTIFSASNYCGHCGNLGGVLVLSAGMDDVIEEHWAPTMEELCLLESDARTARARIKDLSKASRARRRKSSFAMEVEVLRRVQELVVRHKTDLFEYWSLVDTSPRGVFCISTAEWRDGCAAVLGDQLPWVMLQEVMGVANASGRVHYVNFLTRYRVAFDGKDGQSASGWEQAVWSKIMETLLRADLPLREALAALDATNNGLVSPNEFARLLESCGVPLSAGQARALLRTFAVAEPGSDGGDTSGRARKPWELSLWHVLGRLQVSLPISASPLTAAGAELASWAVPLLRPIATVVLDDAWRRLAEPNARVEDYPAARLLAMWFEDADTSRNGYLECEEFVQALERLTPALRRAGCPVDRQSLAGIGKHCDVCGNGRINYFELLNGMSWEDSLGPEFEQDMLETINAFLYFNMATIKRALQRFDVLLSGHVLPADFVASVRAVHAALRAESGRTSREAASLTTQQLDTIVNNMEQDENGMIDYETFLNSFQIVDTLSGIH